MRVLRVIIRVRVSLFAFCCALGINVYATPSVDSLSLLRANKASLDSIFNSYLGKQKPSPDSVLRCGEFLLSAGNHLNYHAGKVRGLLLKGIAHLDHNQLDSASVNLLKAISMAEQTMPGSLEEGLSKNFLGSVFFRMNSYSRALAKFQEATTIFRNIKNSNYLCLSLSNIGSVYGAQSDYAKALEYFLEAQTLTSGKGMPSDRKAAVLSNIALVYNYMKSKKEALKFAFAALAIDEESGNKVGVCQSLNAIAGVYSHHNEYDSALYYYKQSLARAVPGDPRFGPIATRSLQNMTNIYSRQGRYEEAISLINSIAKRQVRTKAYQMETVLNIIAYNQLKLKLYDSAIFYAQRALIKAKEFNVKISIRNSYQYLQESYFAKGRMDSAYHYLKLYHAYNDSIFNQTNKTKFDNLRLELETIGKQQEIDSLQKESVLQRAKLTFLQVSIALGILVVTLLIISLTLAYRNREKKRRLKNLELEEELSDKKKDLHQQALRILYINNRLVEIETSLKKLQSGSDGHTQSVQQLLNTIHVNKSLEKEWDSFNEYFSDVHDSFSKKVDSLFPELSIAERRLISLIKMNLNNREISSILNIEPTSVKMAKYRLKKKLHISEEIDIHSYFQRL